MSMAISRSIGAGRASIYHALCITLLAMVCYALIIFPALATGIPSAMGSVVCTMTGFAFGNLGRGLCTLAIVIVGVGATLGKVSWGMAITVAVGIAVVSNAAGLSYMLANASLLGDC